MECYWQFAANWDGERFVTDPVAFIVSGYCYMLELQNESRPTIKGSGNKQWLATLFAENPSEAELVVDAVLSSQNSETVSGWTFGEVMGGIFSNWGIYDRTNHLKDEEHPWGSNIGFLDGHVDWTDDREAGRRFFRDGIHQTLTAILYAIQLLG